MVTPNFSNNPLIQADLQRMGQATPQQPPLSNDQVVALAQQGQVSHLGGTLPDFLRGIIPEAKDLAKKALKPFQNTTINIDNQKTQLNPDLAVNALMQHESRGALAPSTTVNATSGATGASQITPIMLDQYNHLTGSELVVGDLSGNSDLQKNVTKTLVEYLASKYKNGLARDWPASTPRLKKFKAEIKSQFNAPIYGVAGEWIAGPNWVAKLDNPTAPGATETVRDYIKRVGDIYNGRGQLTLNQ